MHAGEHWRAAADVSYAQRQVLLAVELVDEDPAREVAPARWQDGLYELSHERLGGETMRDDAGDAHDGQAVLRRHRVDIVGVRVLSVRREDVAHPHGGLQAGDARQVHGGLGPAGANENAARIGEDREEMAGRDEVLRSRAAIGGHLQRARAVGS